MNPRDEGRKGGIQINASGNASVRFTSEGEFVGGDKISNSTNTNIQHGFTGEREKLLFQEQVGEMKEALRALKASIEESHDLVVDDREAIAEEILRQISSLREMGQKASLAKPGNAPSSDITSTVEKSLERAGGIVEKLKSLSDNSSAVADAVGKFVVRYAPLLASVRQLFGLP
jgi:hypothetical protein